MKPVLSKEYKKKKALIKKRLKEFEDLWKLPDKRIFSELCFCICTPQSNAVYCDKAISELYKNGALFKGDIKRIKKGLKAVRFPNNKARYIVETRRFLTRANAIRIKERIDPRDICKTRLWLADNILGLGLKEASHFLRNIGFGKNLAILDVHILKNMVRYGLIKRLPKNISKAVYLELETKLRNFSKRIKIPMAELDLVFWSMETGKVFK